MGKGEAVAPAPAELVGDQAEHEPAVSDGADGPASSSELGYGIKFAATPSGDTTVVSVEIETPDLEPAGRRPLDVVCVVDVSGSMGSMCSPPDDDAEADNLTRLDLVQHSVKTVVSCLAPGDRFSLVSFESDVRTEFELAEMSNPNREAALAAVAGLGASGGTQLWKGIRQGFDIATKAAEPGRTAAVMLLTDGVPSDAGHMLELEKYLDAAGPAAAQVSMSTFGFGYDLNSALLDQLAGRCGGLFTFIPDSSFVGTAFVNNLSNLFATMEQGLELYLEPTGAAEILAVRGTQPGAGPVVADGRVTAQVQLGPALYGQSRTVAVEMRASGAGGGLRVKLSQRQPGSAPAERAGASVELEGARSGGEPAAVDAEVALYRHMLGEAVARVTAGREQEHRDEVKRLVAELIDALEKSEAVTTGDARAAALLEDLKGQVTEATSRPDWYDRWGRHYLPSLARSHQMQQCSNFKDPGLQLYGGKIFHDARDTADDVFVSLPPPVATVRTASGHVTHRSVNMSSYYNSGGGCFAGKCPVLLADGRAKSAAEVRKGDLVATAAGGVAAVVCAVRTSLPHGVDQLCELPGGLLITPYHPVRLTDGSWRFPIDVAPVVPRAVEAVFTFVLETGHTMIVSGVECVTLGHNFTEPVVAHAYLGTNRVVADLAQMRGFDAGLVDLVPDSFVRDRCSHQIVGLVAPADVATCDRPHRAPAALVALAQKPLVFSALVPPAPQLALSMAG